MPTAGEQIQLINTSDQPVMLDRQSVPPGAAIDVRLAVDFEPQARSGRAARGPWGGAGWTTNEIAGVAQELCYAGTRLALGGGWLDYPASTGQEHTVSGTLKLRQSVWSPQLSNRRDLLVHLPPSYGQGDTRYPVIYMHDGQNLFDNVTSFSGEWGVDETMESIGQLGLEAIIVGVPNMGEHRLDEYSPFVQPGQGGGRGAAYVAFLVETVKPLIDRDLRTLPGREQTGIFGSSMGGLISLYAFFSRPQSFGFAGVMSPALWFARRAIFPFMERAPFVPGRLYLDAGTEESYEMLADVRRMRRLLRQKGYQSSRSLRYVEDSGAGHTEAVWARRLPAALAFLLSTRSAVARRARPPQPAVPLEI